MTSQQSPLHAVLPCSSYFAPCTTKIVKQYKFIKNVGPHKRTMHCVWLLGNITPQWKQNCKKKSLQEKRDNSFLPQNKQIKLYLGFLQSIMCICDMTLS